VTCSKRCRQARHRFTRAAAGPAGTPGVAGGHPRRLAYADPPYPGMAARYYRDHPDYGGEVDHAALIRRLCRYDGWAVSTSAAALPAVLALCPPPVLEVVRVAAWHRGERPTRAWHPLSAWEPVLYVPARPLDPTRHPAGDPSRGTGGTRRVDSLVHGIAPMTTLPGRVIGTKPAVFCRWLFDLLAALPGDDLDDLFPGSGAVTRAWQTYNHHPSPPAEGDTSTAAGHDGSPSTAHLSAAAGRDTSPPPADATPTRRADHAAA